MTTNTQIHGFDVADLRAVAHALYGGYEAAHSGHESTAGFAARFIRTVISNAESGQIRVGTMTAGNVTNVVVPPGTNLALNF